MMRHPYSPANKKGMVLRIHTTPNSVPIQERSFGPCMYIEHGQVCGKPERVGLHREPYFMTAYAKDPAPQGDVVQSRKQRDVPVL